MQGEDKLRIRRVSPTATMTDPKKPLLDHHARQATAKPDKAGGRGETSGWKRHGALASLCMVALFVVALFIAASDDGSDSYRLPEPEPEIDPLMDHFVRVVDGKFVVGPSCDLFYVSGWNQWETVEAATGVLKLYGASLPKNMTGQELVKSQLRKAYQHGFNVVRTWANPVVLEHALLEEPGVYNEAMFRGLDYFLDEARKSNVRVILNLLDNWQEAGGIPHMQTLFPSLETHEHFFFENDGWVGYASHVKQILNRRNSINGRLYREDPTIFSWELLNEPRCGGCPKEILDGWIEAMGEFVKDIDPNHLLTVGEEGFFDNEDEAWSAGNPSGMGSWAGDQGQSFFDNHNHTSIDYAGIHMWIQNWEEATPEFAERWLQYHVDLSAKLGKPLIMSEFGAWGHSEKMVRERDVWYQRTYDYILENAKAGGPFQGGLFWQWFAIGQKTPREEGGGDGGVFGIFESDASFKIAKRFTDEIQAINRGFNFSEHSTGASCPASVAAKPVANCTSTRVRNLPGTGYEGRDCDININECSRGSHDCHPNAECVDREGAFLCGCRAGYTGNGRSCKLDARAMRDIRSSFQSLGPTHLACNPGRVLDYKPGYPGYMYDGSVNLQTVDGRHHDEIFYEWSTRPVDEEDCMIACRMAKLDKCNAFTFDSLQRKCQLHHVDEVPWGRDTCPQPAGYCVALRGQPYECSLLETYFDTSKFPDGRQETKPRTVRDTVLSEYLRYLGA